MTREEVEKWLNLPCCIYWDSGSMCGILVAIDEEDWAIVDGHGIPLEDITCIEEWNEATG